MACMIALVGGLFGLIIGSFLNVLILRRGVRSIGGRSGCAQCGHTLAWYDLIPVLSWVSLRGRCRYCGSRVSAQYPLVEFSTGVLFALILVWASQPIVSTLPHDGLWLLIPITMAYLTIVSLLVCISVYDLRHTIIPDGWVYGFAAVAFISQLLTPLPDMFPWELFLASGPITAAPLFMLWAVSHGRWMGFGDVKLALGMGWLLGPLAGLFAVFFGFVIGSLILVPLLLLGRVVTHMSSYAFLPRGLTMKSEVPFGPFLIASTLIVWISLLYGYDLPGMLGW